MIYGKDRFKDYVYRGWPEYWTDKKDAEIIILLASGKCGTKTLAKLLNLSSGVFSEHEMSPRMWHIGDRVFHDQCKNPMWGEIYWGARRDAISVCNWSGLVFCEVNHRISVLLPAFIEMFPKAKYVMLWRDFDETVVSGSRWGWYSKIDITAEGRIMPPTDENIKDSRVAVAWYWVNIYKYLLDIIELFNVNVVNFPFEWIRKQNINNILSVFEKLAIPIPEKQEVCAVLDKKYHKAQNLQEIPKVWHKFDREAAEVTNKLREVGSP